MPRQPAAEAVGRQGVRSDPESEGFEEKHRAAINGGYPDDEQVGQRWGKVEPALWGRRRYSFTHRTKVFADARYGKPGSFTSRMASSPWNLKSSGGKARYKLTRDRIKSKLNRQNLYAIPTQKSVDRFKDHIRALTRRRTPLRLGELIETINPIIRGWGNYYCRSHVRKRFHQLDGWIIRRLWSHRAKRWRNAAWATVIVIRRSFISQSPM